MCARACERMSLWEQTLALHCFVEDKILGMQKPRQWRVELDLLRELDLS